MFFSSIIIEIRIYLFEKNIFATLIAKINSSRNSKASHFFIKMQKHVVRHKKKFGAMKKQPYICSVILKTIFLP